MKSDEIERELQRLREASERVSSNLLELEIDSSRQLLEASALSGESAACWTAASAALTDLWLWRELLDAFLKRADELGRSGRGMRELESLLSGQPIELARASVPLAERDLLGSPEVTVRCTPDELLERMSASFDEVKIVVARFGLAWESLTPRLTVVRADLDQARTLADGVGESGRADLNAAIDRLARLTTALSADPLSVDPAEVDRLSESVQAIRRDLEAAAALRRDLDARLGDSRALLRELQSAVEEARGAHQELLIKISVPSAPGPPELGEDLGAELDQIAALGRSGAWREAHRSLEAWTDRTRRLLRDAQEILHSNRAPIEARNQLRSLLEAYQVKAGRLGAIEDPELERVFNQAHETLYTAPTDLTLAAQLIRRYQEILSLTRPAPEVLR